MDHSTTSGDGHARTVPDPKQFTHGLIYDVVKALEAHGYGPFDGRQLVELGQHLLHYLHGRGNRCYGESAVTVEPTSVEEHRTTVAQKLTSLRESGAAVDAALVRYDRRWGHEL